MLLPIVGGRLRILHIISGLGNGGAEATLFRLVHGSADCLHVVVSISSRGVYADRLEKLGVTVFAIGSIPARSLIWAFPTLWRLVSDFQPDIVQGWMYHGNLIASVLARFHRKAALVWGIRHSNLVMGVDRIHTVLVSWICARISPWVPDAVVFAGHESERVHISAGYRAKRMIVIPNGFDTAHLRPDIKTRRHMRTAFALPDNQFTIGSVARFSPQKDHRSLFAALGMLQERGIDFRCVLVGPGMVEGNAELLRLAEEFGVAEKLLLLGSIDSAQPVMVSVDLLVSSSSFGEAFPNVLAEAMACGTPCVATNVGDSEEIIGEYGWLVKKSDPLDLEKGLVSAFEVFTDKAAWEARSMGGRERISKLFGLEKMLEEYKRLWSELVSAKHRKRDTQTRFS